MALFCLTLLSGSDLASRSVFRPDPLHVQLEHNERQPGHPRGFQPPRVVRLSSFILPIFCRYHSLADPPSLSRYDSLNSLNFKSHAGAGSGGASGGAGSRDVFKTIGEVRDEGIGMNDRMEWFTVKATISYIKLENCSYPACSTDGCNKKVVEDGGSWRCEKCDKSWDSPTWR